MNVFLLQIMTFFEGEEGNVMNRNLKKAFKILIEKYLMKSIDSFFKK